MDSSRKNPFMSWLSGMSEERKMTYYDFQLQELFEGLCEQVFDYLGPAQGKKFLCDKFKGFEDAIDIKFSAFYGEKKRITKKLDEPDPQIMKICEGWK